MKAALFQYDPVWEDLQRNMQKIQRMADKIGTQVDMMILPELTLTGFTMRSKSFAEDLDGPSMEFFRKLAREQKSNLFAGLIERGKPACHNCLVHIDPEGSLAAIYRKIHPFSYSGENRFYTGGKNPVISRIGNINIGLTVCYDLRFPELYRIYGKARTDLIINIANWPDSRIAHWQTLLKARAIENQCYVIGVNRVGKDKKNAYNGCSAVIHPSGNEILQTGNREDVFIAEIDFDEVEDIRRNYPFLEDMVLI